MIKEETAEAVQITPPKSVVFHTAEQSVDDPAQQDMDILMLRFRETSITGRHSWRDAVISDSLARWHTVSARLADCVAVSKSSHTGAQLHLQNMFKLPKKLQVSMPHAAPKEMTLGEYPDPDLEVSLIQQRERFKRSLARADVLDISEICWLGAVASIAMVRREQHKRFHEWVLSASNPRAPRGAGIGKLHRHVNSPNVARSLCQVSKEEGVLRSTPSALMEVREAAWAKRWQRDTADSVALVAELGSLRGQAIGEPFWNRLQSRSWTEPCDAFQTTQASAVTVCNQEPSSTHLSMQNRIFALSWTAS